MPCHFQGLGPGPPGHRLGHWVVLNSIFNSVATDVGAATRSTGVAVGQRLSDASPASPPHNHHHTNSCSKGDCASHIQQWCVEIQYVQVPALSLQCCGVTKPTLHYQRKGPPTGGNGGLRAGCWTIRHTTPATHNQAAIKPVVGPWTQRTSLFSAA